MQRDVAVFVERFARGNDGFHLAADIDEDLVAIGKHNGAVHELTTPQLCVLRLFVLFEQRAHSHVLGVVAELSARLYVLSAGCGSCLLLGAFRRLIHSVQNELPTYNVLNSFA
jgi:hypothetical protein